MQKGIPVVPKSVQEHHLRQNLQLFKLREADFRSIEDLLSQRGPVRFLDPSPHIGFDIFDEENDQLTADKAPWDELTGSQGSSERRLEDLHM